MDACSEVVMHIRSGSGTLEGIMLGLKEINYFMEIKISDSGIDTVPCPSPDTLF
jgi:hypothetical protein